MLCKNNQRKIKVIYRRAKNQATKVVAKTMKYEAEKKMNVLSNKSNDALKIVAFIRKVGEDMHGGNGMKDRRRETCSQ